MSSGTPKSARATVADLQAARDAGQRFTVLTAYDRATAEIAEAAGVRAILVGESLMRQRDVVAATRALMAPEGAT